MFSNDKSLGEIIRDMETSGAFGHFQRMHMKHGVDKGTGSFILDLSNMRYAYHLY
jgi:hypothetical protein